MYKINIKQFESEFLNYQENLVEKYLLKQITKIANIEIEKENTRIEKRKMEIHENKRQFELEFDN